MLALGAHILKLEKIQARLVWSLHKEDTQICEAFHF